MKKNKLYTANKWNRPAFMPEPNIFAGGGWTGLAQADKEANPWNYADDVDTTQQYMQSENAFGISKADNPFSKGNLQGGLKSMANTPIGGSMIGAVGGLVGNALNKGISGGLSSGAGNAIGSIGSTVGGALSSVNPLLGGIVSVGSGIIGGGINALFGSKVDEAKLNAAKAGTAAYNNFVSNASSFDGIQGLTAQANVQDAYKGGLFSSGSARRKNEELRRQREEARMFAERSIDNNIFNLQNDQLNNELANFSAFGGPIETSNMGAIEYGFMSDYLTQKKKETEAKNKMLGISTIPAINTFGHGGCFNPFALGGDVQMHGADFTNGLISINAGGSHEANPNEGVQLGVDPEGTPNLVEENETIFDDYVYSNRILADAQTKEKFGLPRKKDITFADISKKLEKESSERPNDPISQAGLKAQMHQLADEQERQKQEMDAQRAKAAFEALSPEEQVAVMEGAAQQEAMAEQAAMQQPSPEEIAMAQQQQAMADGSQAALGQEAQVMAKGGHLFPKGGKLYEKLFNAVGVHTAKDFKDWAKKNGVVYFADLDNDDVDLDKLPWEQLMSLETFRNGLAKTNPALADAMRNGYDFGAYQAPAIGSKVYDWNNFWEPTNEYSKQAGNADNKYRIDSSYKGKVKDLEASDNYKAFTDYILNNATDEERMNYFKWIDENTGRKNKYISNGKLVNNWKDMYTSARNDGLYGIQHYTPGMTEATRGVQAGNFVVNDDGTVEQWYGDVPQGFTSLGNYAWQDKDSDFSRNYYKRPVAAEAAPEGAKTPAEEKAAGEKGVAPKHRPEWLRYAGLFGPAVGLGMMAAGVGRPDTAQLDAAVAGAGDVNTADWKPLGNYLTYRPLDIWFEQNRLNANARATDRAILNSGANQGSKMAGLLAAGYNDQIASGNLFRQAQEYNDNLRKQVAEFNRGTDQFNSEQYGATSRFNADAYNNARRASAQLRLQAAAQKMDADAGWYNSLYGNIAGLFKGIGDIGTENFRMNRIGEMAARGDFGTATDETYGFEPYLTRSNRKSKKNR